MTIRTAIARWLAPEPFKTAERYWFLRLMLDDAQRFLGYEFPEVDETIFWAKVSEVNHFRGLDDPSIAAVPGKPWIHTISDFREYLRTKGIERRARAIYEGWADQPGYVPWVEGGNSSKQEDARHLARKTAG